MRNRIVEEDLQTITGQPLPWTDLAGKTVVVSGANGFLPAYLVETLLYLNETRHDSPTRVIACVRDQTRAVGRFAAYAGRRDLQLMVQDVCAPLALNEKVDVVIHAASQASPRYFGRDPVGTLSANVLGTHQLLVLARDRGASNFLFLSSSEVYGQVLHAQIPIREDASGWVDPMDVRSCYAESKRMGETMCVAWAHQYGVPVRIVRPFHTYGPGMRLDDGRVFADFVADIVGNRDIIMKSDGRACRAFCYLGDAVAGFFAVLLKGVACQAYNIGNDKAEISILDLAHLLVGLFPEKGLRVVQQEVTNASGYLPSRVARQCPDVSKARALGWQPTTSITVGFKRTIESYQ